MSTLPLDAPDARPNRERPKREKERTVGDDRLSATYCTLPGHRFLRAHLLVPMQSARTVLGFEAWGWLSEDSWQAWLARLHAHPRTALARAQAEGNNGAAFVAISAAACRDIDRFVAN